jgi:hypothetical protein
LLDKSKYDANKMSQQVELDIKIMDQLLDIAVHENRETESWRCFIEVRVEFLKINFVGLWADMFRSG